jgi:hypothetical protein
VNDLAAFLAEDFARIEPVAPSLAALDGQRLALSGVTGFFGKNLLGLLAYLHAGGLRFEVVGLSRNPQRFFATEPWAARLPWLHLLTGDASEPWPAAGPFDLLLHAATDTHASASRRRCSTAYWPARGRRWPSPPRTVCADCC